MKCVYVVLSTILYCNALYSTILYCTSAVYCTLLCTVHFTVSGGQILHYCTVLYCTSSYFYYTTNKLLQMSTIERLPVAQILKHWVRHSGHSQIPNIRSGHSQIPNIGSDTLDTPRSQTLGQGHSGHSYISNIGTGHSGPSLIPNIRSGHSGHSQIPNIETGHFGHSDPKH